ncbi:MAG: hypothetical protein MJ223_02670 [Mycoplasmoidaceae bacterium]|nr:hypothetical protein [Mycoplasmoidaceae bacterium]
MLNIIYACNDKLFKGLYLSILSILKRTDKNINFYILSGDLQHLNDQYKSISNKHLEMLEGMIKNFNDKSKITLLDCSKKYVDYFGKDFDVYRFTPYALFRLFIPSFEELNGVGLYLDVDTMANGDISLAFDIDTSDVEAVVCHDYLLNNTLKDEKLHFDSGVMLLNINEIRKTKYFDKALAFYKKYKPEMADQVALNST